MKVLIVVDAQVDFTTGALSNPNAVEAIPRIEAMVHNAHEHDQYVIWTKDTHSDVTYKDSLEGHFLPVEHCIKGTYGHQITPVLNDLVQEGDLVIEKPTFGSLDLINELMIDDEAVGIDLIDIVGFCTDICVISNALLLRAAFPNTPIYVHADCCAGSSVEAHEAALKVLESCQIQVI